MVVFLGLNDLAGSNLSPNMRLEAILAQKQPKLKDPEKSAKVYKDQNRFTSSHNEEKSNVYWLAVYILVVGGV